MKMNGPRRGITVDRDSSNQRAGSSIMKIFLPSSFFPLKKGFSIRNPPKSLSLPHLPSSKSLDFSHKSVGEFSHFRWFRRRRMAAVGGVKEVEGSANSLEIDTLARFAVDEHNKKQNSLLQFGKVVNTKQQVVAGTVYYITLEATDGGTKKVYEAKIWSKPWLNFQELQEFKFIGDA